ncbi:hypothetical protein APUTEX25_001332, partial [Auxenochlorella protothecoides]
EHPEFDGRGIVVAILDTGIDPGAAALQTTPNGRPKIIDVLDCTGSGDVDTSTLVTAAADYTIQGVRGSALRLNPAWDNPSGKWHVGSKRLFDLVPKGLADSIRADRRRVWMQEQRDLLAKATAEVAKLSTQGTPKVTKEEREELEARVALLSEFAEKAEDEGPVLDAVVWQDASSVWWAALDLTELRGPARGALADFKPMTDFKARRQYTAFSPSDACNFAVNIYDGGNILSIVVDAGSHGTHVAGITAAYDAAAPHLSGVAPGAQLISCKIGDTRLGSMETAPGLYRALAAVIQHKADIINMSYGESTATPNSGRFIELAEEVVHEHGVVFVSSAGNSGPALCTVGAPGGTSSAILGVGAWVAPEMAAAGHALREPLRDGQQYNWSSRGPAPDGDVGVALCAPGGAVAPVPRWTRQRRQLMNGTSMASPCAAGAIALVLSGLKAQGVRPSPARLRRGLEATCLRTSWDADSVLSQGAGLIQVADAHAFLLAPCSPAASQPWQVTLQRTDAGAAAGGGKRGVFLRTGQETAVTSTHQVTVKPWFKPEEVAARLDMEVRAELSSERSSFVSHPKHLLLYATGRSFEIQVDPRSLEPGLHHTEIRGTDTSDPGAGTLFTIPITVAVPTPVTAGGSQPGADVEIEGEGHAELQRPHTFDETLMFAAGIEARRFLDVPEGATWAELRLTASMETPKTLMLRATQLAPHTRFSDTEWAKSVQLADGGKVEAAFAVSAGTPLELTVAQMWNSCVLRLSLTFHGVTATTPAKGLLLNGAAGIARLTVRAPLGPERIQPKASLTMLCIPLCPTAAELAPLSAPRDALPRSRLTHQLTLTYSLTLVEGGTVTPRFPRLNRLVYDGILDGQMHVVTDANKKVLGWGDIYPEGIKLGAGTFAIRVALRHTDADLLQKFKDLPLVAERKLDPSICVPVYTSQAACVTGGAAAKELSLVHGSSVALFLGNPAEDKLPKDATAGRILSGSVSLGTLASSPGKESPDTLALSFVVPPPKSDVDKGKGNAPENGNGKKDAADVDADLEKAVLAAQVAFLKACNWLLDLKDGSEEERSTYQRLWDRVFEANKGHLPLLTERLTRLDARSDKDSLVEDRVAAADAVIAAIDTTKLAVYLAQKSPETGPDKDSRKKDFELQRDAIIQALASKASALLTKYPEVPAETETDEFEAAFVELQKWVDTSAEGTHANLNAQRLARKGQLALAYRALDKALADDKLASKHKGMLETRVKLLKQLGWSHWEAAAKARLEISFPATFPLF